ncbi:histidine phosphatase family protein [Nocardiopsis sp. YSL2]|uniref:histidine phosphatase family protein n=1 Tax=Nocardiopsis sp. YSL2 TaxID=2939492 RepID=UPI0026F43F92|nr:histidine phosphatase family protein [Nocardiopsis sp. YSL2]
MPAIYLIRHGKASPEAADYDELSPTGYEQAMLLGREITRRGLRVGPVVTGTLRRQKQTAAAALAEAGLDTAPVTDERWNEYDHLALLDRYSPGPGSIQHRIDACLHAWTADGGAGKDSWTAFRDTAAAALRDLAEGLERGSTALVFTSGGVISAVCSSLLGVPAAGFVSMNRVVVNGSVSKVAHGRGGTQVLSFNDHAHLERDGSALLTYR